MTGTLPVPVIQGVIDAVLDKRRMSEGIRACGEREADFSSPLEMQLAGIAMQPEARELMSSTLTEYWRDTAGLAPEDNLSRREVIIGAGYHAAVYAASRVAAGFPRPIVLERGGPEAVGGAFAVSLQPVFRLNSRSRPGTAGLPDQDKALNDIPGALLQPGMISSEEYATNADMAWLIRLALAQFADVRCGVTVRGTQLPADILVETSGGNYRVKRLIDASGAGDPVTQLAKSPAILTFPQLMARMGTMFPLRGMRQVAIIGGGNSGLCAAESLLGIAPGHTSLIGLDYVSQVDLYSRRESISTCAEFREGERGRYIRLAQYLAGNASSPTSRLRVIPQRGFASPVPGGVLVNDRTYDMAVLCTGLSQSSSGTRSLGFYPVPATGQEIDAGTAVATRAAPREVYRVGPAAGLPFTEGERAAGIAGNKPSRAAMFRLGPRTAALAMSLPGIA